MNDLNRRRAWFVADMINYYAADPTRRGIVTILQITGGTRVICRYRGDNGTKCQIGRYIPDSAYYPQLESEPLQSDAVIQTLPLKIADLGIGFLMDCQKLHDSPQNWGKGVDCYGCFNSHGLQHLRGLTDKGRSHLECIIYMFELRMPNISNGRYLIEQITDPPVTIEDIIGSSKYPT